jgi:hypothetical protein
MKDAQATGEAFSPQKRTYSTSQNMKILYFFLFFGVIFALLIRIRNLTADPDSGIQQVKLMRIRNPALREVARDPVGDSGRTNFLPPPPCGRNGGCWSLDLSEERGERSSSQYRGGGISFHIKPTNPEQIIFRV